MVRIAIRFPENAVHLGTLKVATTRHSYNIGVVIMGWMWRVDCQPARGIEQYQCTGLRLRFTNHLTMAGIRTHHTG